MMVMAASGQLSIAYAAITVFVICNPAPTGHVLISIFLLFLFVHRTTFHARLTQKERDLANHEVIGLFDRDSPQDQTNGKNSDSRVSQPDAHLRSAGDASCGGEPSDDLITQPAAETHLRHQGAHDKPEEHDTLADYAVVCVRHGYDGLHRDDPGLD